MFKLARWLVPAFVIAALVTATSARAATTYTVNTTADNAATGSECSGAPGDCSLRQALDKAVSGDTVLVPASATPYSVSAGKITIADGVTVQGAGASSTVISGGGTSQIFELPGGAATIGSLTLTDGTNSNSTTDESGTINNSGSPVNLTLDSVVIKNGHSDGGWGGALEAGGTFTIKNSRFTNNSASGGGGGGAIDFYGSSHVTISNSVFDHNTHADSKGGAIVFEGGGTTTITTSTFSGNSVTAGAPGGALEIEGGETAAIENTTFSGNSAPTTGGGIHFASTGTSLTLVNDTLSGNSAPSGANIDDAGPTTATNTIFAAPAGGGDSCTGALATSGHDLDDSATNSCGLSAGSGDLIGVNPGLGALADNSSQVPTPGGPPQTMALPVTSAAVGAGDASVCTTLGNVDERGFPRPGIAGKACDIGAFEAVQLGTATALSSSTTHPGKGQAITLTATVAPAAAAPPAVPGPSGTVIFKDGSTVLGSAPLNAGHATLTTPSLPTGTHQITAAYSGDLSYVASASSAVAVTVAPPRPKISRLHQSHKVWRLGSKHARISRKIPVGTRFTFKLNTASNLRLTFRKLNGRHKGKRAGTLTFKHAKAGTRKLSFQGRLKGHRKLAPGRYALTLTASNSAGHSSRTIKFRIVKG